MLEIWIENQLCPLKKPELDESFSLSFVTTFFSEKYVNGNFSWDCKLFIVQPTRFLNNFEIGFRRLLVSSIAPGSLAVWNKSKTKTSRVFHNECHFSGQKCYLSLNSELATLFVKEEEAIYKAWKRGILIDLFFDTLAKFVHVCKHVSRVYMGYPVDNVICDFNLVAYFVKIEE